MEIERGVPGLGEGLIVAHDHSGAATRVIAGEPMRRRFLLEHMKIKPLQVPYRVFRKDMT